MSKLKQFFKLISLPFALVGAFILGTSITSANIQSNFASAEFSSYDSISNNLPNYFKIATKGNVGTIQNSNTIYLFNAQSEMSITIADNEKTSSTVTGIENWCYFPDKENAPQEYYYFDFQNSLSLFYNLTNSEIDQGLTGVNLMQSQSINSYIKNHEKSFTPDNLNITPSQLNVKFKLDTNKETISFDNGTITLANEGCYTLTVPLISYYTDNDGITYSSKEETINFTFMIFNSNTYFNSTTGLPNLSSSASMQESTLPSSSTYSRYYFYSYSYGGQENSLAYISYDPNIYQMQVTYTDLNSSNKQAVIEYANGIVKMLDENGNQISEENEFIHTLLSGNKNYVFFNNLGQYQISLKYLYKSINGDRETIYALPLNNLNETSLFRNQDQKVFVYGYQAVYSNYSKIDSETNQPVSSELKDFNYENKSFFDSADITSAVNNSIKRSDSNPNQSTAYNLRTDKLEGLRDYALAYINNSNIEPVSTNQVPVKFLTNATLSINNSKFYTLQNDGQWNDGETFEGFNQNSSGTYLYIIQYQYDNFMSTSGTLQNLNYHYQIFYFKVTNTAPTVTVLDQDFNEIYSSGFTNKNVYVLNDAENNKYDAQVEISISAYNYKNGTYYFKDLPVSQTSGVGMSYRKFEKDDSKDENDTYNTRIAGKSGILIETTNVYANAKFSVSIKSTNSKKPNIKTFTIDTNDISGLSARSVSLSSNTSYRIGEQLSSYNTNSSFVLSWNEKQSGAKTYGYVKYIPMESISYYSSQTDASDLSQLLLLLLQYHNTLPVSYKINIEKSSGWTEYFNSIISNNIISSTYVKSNNGFYILQVYDEAGNSNFGFYLIDKTQPIFVQTIDGDYTVRQLMANSESISVPEANTEISIEWAKNKAIYIENIDSYKYIDSYEYAIGKKEANEKLHLMLDQFFSRENNNEIQSFGDLGSITPKSATGITSYNGYYLIIPIEATYFIMDGTSSNYKQASGSSYKITFIDKNDKAIEASYSILIRDKSNSATSSNIQNNYKNNPSAYLSFNVTSDASKTMVKYESDPANGTSFKLSTFNMDGKLYNTKSTNEEPVYTHLPKSEDGTEYNQTDKSYKFSYYTPVNAKEPLQLSYIPVAKNGSKIKNITLKYYSFTKASKDVNGVKYFYYDISSEPTKTINVFTSSEDKIYEADEVVLFDIRLSSTDTPLAGKYIIERTYSDDNTTDKYDYFQRSLTFTVDSYGLITPLESVSDGENTALESVVGGDILLSLYAGENNSSIEVSFPRLNSSNLNSGSFYSQESFPDENENLTTFSIEGSKLPMSLYVPKYKYTIYNQKDNDTNKYSVEENGKLSYYGNAEIKYDDQTGFYNVYVEGIVKESFTRESEAKKYLSSILSINEYEIYVKIVANVVENGKNVTKYYYSNGSTIGNYLTLFSGDKGGSIDENSPVEFFSNKGNYEVTIYQANNVGSSSKFYSFYKFGFVIESQEPDFDIINEDGYLLTETNIANTYYTNSKTLTIEWQVPTNDYLAKIDEDAISISLYPQTATAPRSEIMNGSSNTRYFTIDCSGLVTAINGSLSITMQYEGYDSNFYKQVVKTIKFDISAPKQNLQTLMTNTENATNKTFTKNYQEYYMRQYVDYKGNNAVSANTNLDNMSYSYSLDNGIFKYYSYPVTTDFFNITLQNTIKNASLYPNDAQFIYYKSIPNLNSYTQTNKASFSANSYYAIYADMRAEVTEGFYEIVELDYAGNMVVYQVYCTNSTDDNDKVSNTAISYTNSKNEDAKEISDDQITTGFNIFSNSGFKLESLSYKQDPWELFSVTLYGQNQVRFLKSPWLNEGMIYQLTIRSSGISTKEVSINSLFDEVSSSSNKHSLLLTNRIDGRYEQIYLSIMDANLNTTKVEDPLKTSAILNISVPTTSQVQSTTQSYVYPNKITIYQYDSASTSANKWNVIMIASQTTYGVWVPTDDYADALSYIKFTTLPTGTTLQVTVSLGASSSSKVKYEIEDNFGNITNVIQLANEVSYNEISGNGPIYSLPESDGSTTYLSSTDVHYAYNTLLYTIAITNTDGEDITATINQNSTPIKKTDDLATNISYFTFSHSNNNIYDDVYFITVKDSETGNTIKQIQIKLYYVLPFIATNLNEVDNGGILFFDKNQKVLDDFSTKSAFSVSYNGNTYTADAKSITTYSQSVSIHYKDGQGYTLNGQNFYQNKYGYSCYLSRDNGTSWENINNTNSATSGITISGTGDYIILIKYDSTDVFTNLCEIFTVSILDSASSYYYITVDGLTVSKSDIKYTDANNVEYQTNYIVGVDYSDKNNRLKITANEELEVKIDTIKTESTGTNVYVEIYYYHCDESVGYFTVIYIEETNNIVSQFTYDNANGTTNSLKSSISEIIVADKETENNFDKVKINFTAYYGIKQNKVHAEVLKFFNGNYVNIYPKVYENGELSYIYLEKAGSYKIKLYDSCTPANIQRFKSSDYVDIVLLNSIPVNVTTVDSDNNTVTTEFIKNAVYNSKVKLTLPLLTSYYSPSGYPKISVLRNGVSYSDFTSNNNEYTFSEPGFYSVVFSAMSTTGKQIREESLSFTILNKNESRYAYEFTKYASYYVKSVYKNGIDVTDDLVNMLNLDTVIVNGKTYANELTLNYLDEKTGGGRYKITICTNDDAYKNTTGDEFTFDLWINMAEPPIVVSLNEGESTSGNITVKFNVENLYNAVGDCYIKVGRITRHYSSENLSTYGETETITISENGTFFVQLYTEGGHLLYSYKVTKTEPLNTFAIIAIVVGVIAVVAIIWITISLRKRQKVK